MTAMEEFVCQLYQKKTRINQVRNLLWQMFKKLQEADKLPPTKSALQHHIYCAHYQAMVWENANVANTENYGWKEVEGQFTALGSDLPPAPKAVIQLVQCGCTTAMCRSRNCSCREIGLVCTEMCSCEGAEEKCTNTRHVQ
jgi:hypothetical protein